MAKNKDSNPNAGRHGAGGKLARPGSIRGGQSVSARPITASRNPQRPVAPVRADAADTSRDIERIISRPENQLSNPYGVVRVPAPANRNSAGHRRRGFRQRESTAQVTAVISHSRRLREHANNKRALAATGDTLPKGYNSIISGASWRDQETGRKARQPKPQHVCKRKSRRLRQTGY